MYNHIIPLIGNNQKKANAMISGSNLKMLPVEDFNIAARTVCCRCIMYFIIIFVGVLF